jgi:hypothetical protein
MKRILIRTALGIAAVTAVAYGIDDVYVRIRHAPYADVTVNRVLVVQENFNKTEYDRTDPATERCVYSLFPHSGHNPCWYVMRHTNQFVKVN